MTSATFDELSRVRTVMTDSMAERNEPSNIFVPWAGSELLDSKRGIYYIGIATDAEYADGEQTYEARLAATESFCARPGRGHAS
jgi:hypothetical protein